MKRAHGRKRDAREGGEAVRVEPVGRRGFGWALAAALLAHAVIITLVVVGMRRPVERPLEWVELMPEGMLAGGDVAEAAMEQAAPPVPEPPPPMPEPAPIVTPKPEPPPEPPPVPAPKKTVPRPPEPAPMPKPEATPKPKAKSTVKVNLDEVTRPLPEKIAPAPKRAPPPTEPRIEASEVRERLEKRLGKMGVRAASDGPSGVAGGTASGEIAAYYALIRDVYYRAWRQPGIPGRTRLDAIVRVRIARDGKILAAAIERGSGEATMDDSVRAAITAVSDIGRPLPEGLGSQFAEVTITFEF